MQQSTITITFQDAFDCLINHLQNPPGLIRKHNPAFYDVYLPRNWQIYLQERQNPRQGENPNESDLEPFYEAAWELCRRGLLRPAYHYNEERKTILLDSPGKGYALTTYGKQWLEESKNLTHIPSDPDQFSKLISTFQDKLGPAFMERANEAIRSYQARANLSCCVMCGAAAEAIVLALAVAKSGDRETTERDYISRGGRGRVENALIGQQRSDIQDKFRSFTELLKYWRDASAHGRVVNISDIEAQVALNRLVLFAQFATDMWDNFTQS